MEKFIIKPSYTMSNSDINVVGEMLGFDWNEICDSVQGEGLYGQDGSGYVIVKHNTRFEDEKIKIIFNKIFSDNPEIKNITIPDDF